MSVGGLVKSGGDYFTVHFFAYRLLPLVFHQLKGSTDIPRDGCAIALAMSLRSMALPVFGCDTIIPLWPLQ